MNVFTISDLERISGIKAHTIRIWEKRYNALNPNRSEGNTRYYSNEQLRRLLNMVSLMEQNMKVSKVCSFSDREIQKHLSTTIDEINADVFWVLQLTTSALEYDELKFDRIYETAVARYGVKLTYLQLIYPTLRRLGLLWSQDNLSPAQEHFITHLIKQKIFASLNQLPSVEYSPTRWILFLPENEFHDIGLMIANYILRESGQRVVYLGPNVPIPALREVASQINPTHLLFFFVGKYDKAGNLSYCNQLSHQFPDLQILVAANPEKFEVNQDSINPAQLVQNYNDLMRFLPTSLNNSIS